MTTSVPVSTTVDLTVNGRRVSATVDGGRRLLDVLRLDVGLTGTKEGCGEGECGTCAVLLDGELVNSCLVPVGQAAGREVITIEGLGTDGRLAPVQASFLELGGTQCGMCAPGMLLAAQALLASRRPSGDADIRAAIAGTCAAAPGTRGSSSQSRRWRRPGCPLQLRPRARTGRAGGIRHWKWRRRSAWGRRCRSCGRPPCRRRWRAWPRIPRSDPLPAAPTSWSRPPRTRPAGARSSISRPSTSSVSSVSSRASWSSARSPRGRSCGSRPSCRAPCRSWPRSP